MSAAACPGLHRVLNLVVDAAISADDALREHDPEALRRAIEALAANTSTAQALAAEILRSASWQ